jgi:uncharacterized protein
MYLMTELILFLPLLVYACIQVRKLISRPVLKNIFVFLFVILFVGYPIAGLLSHRETGGWARYILIVGYYCLPYLLYITLSVAVIDLGIALMRKLRFLSPGTMSNPRFRYSRLGCYFLIPALIVAAGALNNDRLKIREYSIELPRKSSSLNELHIVFASDFHLSQITSGRLVERFVDKVNALHPDIVLIGGDVLEGDRNEDLNKVETRFRKIRSKYGVYAAAGNHERHRGGAREFFTRSGFKLLEDDIEKIGAAFYLAIRQDGRASTREPIAELLKAATEDLPVILLDHRPTDLEEASNSRVDLQLSGHTHNGQLFPVNLVVMPFQYELAWGTKVKRNTVFIVSSGVQAWGPPVKTAGDSEILSIKISFRGAATHALMRENP